MGLNIYGAALLDLIDQLNASFKEISYAIIGSGLVISGVFASV